MAGGLSTRNRTMKPAPPSSPRPKCRPSASCGSRSSATTRRPLAASPAATFAAIVVLPTPPFGEAKQISVMAEPMPGRAYGGRRKHR